MLKRDNYINIQAWMITELGLTGNDLIIYAVIYGFSQDGDSIFMGNRAYLAEWCNASIATVKRSLKYLRERGLIEQVHHSKDNMEVYYKAYLNPRVKMTLPMGQNDPTHGSNCHGPRVKMTQPIKDDNIEDTIKDNLRDSIVVCETPTRPRFKKPTREEVKAYAERNGTAVVDPGRFYDYYEANGWKAGKNTMKDWQAAFRNWERTEKGGKPSTSAKSNNIPYMQNEYSKEHLEQREADSLRVLDELLDEGGQ